MCVYFQDIAKARSAGNLRVKFDLFVFNKKGEAYHIRDALERESLHYNESAVNAYSQFCRHETDSYFTIFVTPENRSVISEEKLEKIIDNMVGYPVCSQK